MSGTVASLTQRRQQNEARDERRKAHVDRVIDLLDQLEAAHTVLPVEQAERAGIDMIMGDLYRTIEKVRATDER